MTGLWVLAQAFAVLSYCARFTGAWRRDRRWTLILTSAASALLGASNICMGLWGIAAINAVATIRGFALAGGNGDRTRRKVIVTGLLFTTLSIGLYLGISGIPNVWWEWLPVVGTSAITLTQAANNPLTLKVGAMAGSVCWGATYALLGSPVPAVVSMVSFTLSVVAAARIVRARDKSCA